MPFSNDRLEGFENRIAALIAKDFETTPTYTWWGQRRGFIRNTMNATLEEGRCDVVIGVPAQYDLVRTTKPYYRSTYVFVYPKQKGWTIASLDDPRLKKLKIGVHLLGDDYTNPPPVHELSKRGVVDNVVGFNTFYSETNPPGAIIDAVAAGRVDLAIVWGPLAGYYAKRQRVAAGARADSVRQGRFAVYFRYLNGREKRQRRAPRAPRASSGKAEARDHGNPEGIRRAPGGESGSMTTTHLRLGLVASAAALLLAISTTVASPAPAQTTATPPSAKATAGEADKSDTYRTSIRDGSGGTCTVTDARRRCRSERRRRRT
jgi:quinoprotein dehydrogenase-associated probable ABC transporter substrate-binding protein